MEPVFSFLGQSAFNRTEVWRTSNEYLGQDGVLSDEGIVSDPGSPFVKFQNESKDQEYGEEDGFYDTLKHALGDACSCFELICQPHHLVNKMVERCFRYQDQADMYDRAAVTVRGLLTNV